jgi:galactokinase
MELLSAGQDISGIDLTIFTNVPIGAGVSSSAALEMSVATLLERLNALELDDAEMVRICRRADHKYVGIKSGPMDQFASRACRAGHAGLLDCRALEMTNFPLPEGIDFLSVYSGIPRMLAASEYNERMESCQSAVNILAESNRQIRALRDATMADVRASRDRMGDRTFRRARHVVSEQDRVFEFVEAAGKLDTAAMGRILAEGHESLSDDYEVSMPILDEMADWLTDQGGIIGARLTGAGFGGSLVCLSVRGEIDVKKLDRDFRQKFDKNTPDDPNIRKFASADGARHMESVKP